MSARPDCFCILEFRIQNWLQSLSPLYVCFQKQFQLLTRRLLRRQYHWLRRPACWPDKACFPIGFSGYHLCFLQLGRVLLGPPALGFERLPAHLDLGPIPLSARRRPPPMLLAEQQQYSRQGPHILPPAQGRLYSSKPKISGCHRLAGKVDVCDVSQIEDGGSNLHPLLGSCLFKLPAIDCVFRKRCFFILGDRWR